MGLDYQKIEFDWDKIEEQKETAAKAPAPVAEVLPSQDADNASPRETVSRS